MGQRAASHTGFMARTLKDHAAAFVVSLLAGLVLLGSSPWWWDALVHHSGDKRDTSIGFEGGCATFRVFAQNRYPPLGAVVRKAPEVTSPGFANYDGNESINTDGWLHGQVAYPTNRPPFDSDVWFHVSTGGWVNFAAVRGEPTVPDPTGGLDPAGGGPAPTDLTCQGHLN